MAADPELLARLQREGPLDLATVFEGAGGPGGYYARQEVFGAAGDFVTAPEISQIFGELVGLALADAWRRQGAPAPFVLAELGPGTGALMADLWRAVGIVDGFRDAARLHLVERSERLRERQRRALDDAPAPRFHADVDALPQGPLFLVANEFLDALPVHQLIRRADGWRERRIGLDAAGAPVWVDAPAPAALAAEAGRRFAHAAPGAVAELAPARTAVVATLAERVATAGGLALVVDYGGVVSEPVDTLQAVRRHRRVDPLAHPGAADLTTAVDFTPLIEAGRAAGCAVFGPVPQATFLRELGIELRAAALARTRRGEAREAIVAGAHRLVDPRTMGEAFKAFALAPPGAPSPAGLALAAEPAGATG
ncbi:MAG: class I SAM-dependent methyltransferase [Alphaproteobacteria bacterium]|jgi:SAM-dependent MidA family methyltransferase|nr:class I SAM-dependent methyltransferase [Alphaproteobacteria bacterium]